MKHSMKQITVFMMMAFLFVGMFWGNTTTVDAASELDLKAESAILVDAETGKVLYTKNPDILLPPASMTKMMTEYLVWEAIENGDISWDTTTQISDYPYSISADPSFSGVGLRQQNDYTVEELYAGMAINSDNATTIALAELIAGSEGEFVKMMNEKGEEMGLTEFKFVNATGLNNDDLGENVPEGTEPTDTNLMSARATAILAYHLVNDYPEALEVSKLPSAPFDGKTMTNWNYMLPHETSYLKPYYYEGVDGLKTGFTELAGYSFAGTASRDGRRLISVVMKTESETQRFEETAKLLDYGFSQYVSTELYAKGAQKEGEETLPVSKGKEENVSISLDEGIVTPVKVEEEENYSLTYHIDESLLNEDGELAAPIEAGTVVGTAEVTYNGETEEMGYITDKSNGQVNLVADETVEKSNWFMLTLSSIGDFFAGVFHTSVDWVKGLFS